MFHAVCYRPDECQIVTAGTDRKVGSSKLLPAISIIIMITQQIGYWETYDGSQIRELDGSQSASINGMDVHDTWFLTGGGDKLIKVKLQCDACYCYSHIDRCGTMTVVK